MEPTGTSLPIERLSPAERRVFDLALSGRSTQGIADELVITEATVRSHLTRIYDKLEVHGRIDLLGHVASQHSTDGPSTQTLPATPQGGLPPWALIGIAVAAVIIGAVIPLAAPAQPIAPGSGLHDETPDSTEAPVEMDDHHRIRRGPGPQALLLVALLTGLSAAAP